MKLVYQVDKECLVKEYLVELGLSKRFCKKVKLYGKMFINGMDAKNYFPLKIGDELILELDEELNQEINPLKEELDVLYEDNYFLVINKPYNLATMPTKKHFLDNLVSLVKNYYLNKGINSNIHIVNRLDYSTSGLVIIALDGLTHYKFSNTFITKKYLAIVHGKVLDHGEVKNYIRREKEGSIKRIETTEGDGKFAHTIYDLIDSNELYSLVDVQILTGRTHQIRVTFSSMNHPIVGDKLYGEGEDDRLYLACYNLKFNHPYTNELIDIKIKDDSFSEFMAKKH